MVIFKNGLKDITDYFLNTEQFYLPEIQTLPPNSALKSSPYRPAELQFVMLAGPDRR